MTGLLNPFIFGGGSPAPGGQTKLDFKNGVYTVAGVSVTVADVIDQPGWVTAAGLEILDTEESPCVSVIGDALAAFLGDNQTVIVEYYERSDSSNSYPFVYTDAGDGNYNLHRLTSGYMNASDTAGIHFRQVTDTAGFPTGIHKIAVSRSNGELSMSVDGNPTQSTTADVFALTATALSLGAAPGSSFLARSIYIRSIERLDLQDVASLPTLSPRPTYSLPGSMLASADFINEVYSVAGSPVTLADIVDTPGALTAFGLEMPYGDFPIGIIGDFLATLTSMDWTILIGYSEDTDDDVTTILGIATNALDQGITLRRLAQVDNLNMQASDFNSTPASRTVTDPRYHHFANLHQIALTRADGRLSMSVNGDPLVTVGTSLTATAEAAAFGGLPGDTTTNGGSIRFIHVWAPMADSALQDLSTVWS
ncbi:hypothetical protein MPL3356_60471 [Mesorhizobium plurifarium]|uniref:Uncharacterized protein n=1 Tax=Mesorhizobium plurifarium TaxID=69974 RepID=A0A090G6J0_MESPL|nr:hypothetical protein MPL3356_60471 [Mesorhizobium plurifarium]